MSTKEREPLLSVEEIERMAHEESELWDEHQSEAKEGAYAIASDVRDIYEAARAKDAELIQRLINCLKNADRYGNFRTAGPYHFDDESEQHRLQQYEAQAIAAAASAGFTPKPTTDGN